MEDPPALKEVQRLMWKKNPAASIDEIKAAIDAVPPGTDMNQELIRALARKKYEIARYLVEKRRANAYEDDVEVFMEDGMPFEGLKIAIDALPANANLNVILYHAIVGGFLDTVKYLVDDKGADPNGHDAYTYHIECAIEYYKNLKGIDILKYMIEKVSPASLARLSMDDPKSTPLHFVAGIPDIPVAIATTMLDRNPGMINNVLPPPSPGRDGGFTALHIAALRNNVDVVRLLKDRGANTQLKTTNGKTAYIFATDATIKRILYVGPDPGSPPRQPPPPPGSNPGSPSPPAPPPPASGGRRRTRSKSRHTRRRTRRRNRI